MVYGPIYGPCQYREKYAKNSARDSAESTVWPTRSWKCPFIVVTGTTAVSTKFPIGAMFLSGGAYHFTCIERVRCIQPVFCIRNNFFFNTASALISDPDPGFGSGLFMKNTLEFILFFLKAQRRSSTLRKKLFFEYLYIFTTLYLLVRNRTWLLSRFESGSEPGSEINYGFGSWS